MKYFAEDLEGMDFAIDTMEDGVNKEALKRLKIGLMKYQKADYSRDYAQA
jgi:hypothetical protein